MKRKRSKTKPSPRGSDKAQRHRFAIKLMRPIFQTAVITVNAVSEERAVRLAFRKAARLKEEEWVGSFDARKYRYDLQNVLDATEFSDEATETSVTAADLAKDLCEMHITEYLLLKADIEGGQGEALNQPWLDEKSYVFLADVAGDWLADIEALEEEGREGYLRRGRRSNVIPFRRPPREGDDDDSK